MESFTECSTGWQAYLSEEERVLLVQVVTEVIDLLDAPVITSGILGAYIEEEQTREAPESPSLYRLLPAMSKDKKLAGELRALTEDTLRCEKTDRLGRLLKEICDPTGIEGAIFVPEKKIWDWLAGLNDVRLAMSARLGLDSSSDVSRLYEQALETSKTYTKRDENGGRNTGDEPENEHDLFLVAVYSALSWWQESLLSAMETKAVGQ